MFALLLFWSFISFEFCAVLTVALLTPDVGPCQGCFFSPFTFPVFIFISFLFSLFRFFIFISVCLLFLAALLRSPFLPLILLLSRPSLRSPLFHWSGHGCTPIMEAVRSSETAVIIYQTAWYTSQKTSFFTTEFYAWFFLNLLKISLFIYLL